MTNTTEQVIESLGNSSEQLRDEFIALQKSMLETARAFSQQLNVEKEEEK